MNKEELDSFEELNINLQDIDDLDMGLEIISYKVRKSLQELADIIINQSCQISTYKDKEDKLKEILPLDLAIYFHETYERLAPSFGYETREETRQFDNNSKNGMLMVAVCEVVLNKLLQILNEGVD